MTTTPSPPTKHHNHSPLPSPSSKYNPNLPAINNDPHPNALRGAQGRGPNLRHRLLIYVLAPVMRRHNNGGPEAEGALCLLLPASLQHPKLVPAAFAGALLGLYLVFKYLNKDLINVLFAGYFLLMGLGALATMLVTITKTNLGPMTWARQTKYKFRLTRNTADVLFSLRFTNWYIGFIAISVILSAVKWYTKQWMLSNLFALSFAFNAITLLKLDSFKTGTILLAGLFIYVDFWWVFGSSHDFGESVMVSVAKRNSALRNCSHTLGAWYSLKLGAGSGQFCELLSSPIDLLQSAAGWMYAERSGNPTVSNRSNRTLAPPGVANNPDPEVPAGSQVNNGVGDLFDRLFHPTGATACNSTRAATAPALGAPIQLRNSASSSTGSNGNSVLRASSVVQRLIDDNGRDLSPLLA
ncbi:hypothetical protein PtB15_4B549 [Puccinia triticina]|nr:hypothetical protein PtB15_4B549 [Puccinia triticina]